MSLAQAKIEVASPRASETTRHGRKRRRRVDPAVLISAFAVIVLASALIHVGQRAKVAALAYEMHQVTAHLDQLQREQTQLLVNVERARSLDRVEADARLRLGMQQPETERLVVVRPSQSSTNVAVAQSESERNSWLAALSGWYDRVSTQVRAALPRPAWAREND